MCMLVVVPVIISATFMHKVLCVGRGGVGVGGGGGVERDREESTPKVRQQIVSFS